MTFEGAIDASEQVGPPDLRMAHLVSLVKQHLRAGDVLDVGCWTGNLARALAKSVPCAYTGVDIEPATSAVEAARKISGDQHFVIVQSVESLPFAAGSFDVVVLTEVIEHILVGRERSLLAELARVLKVGGSIILSTPHHNLLNPLDPAWFFGHRHYTVSQLAACARDQGLRMTDVEFSGGIWSALNTNLLYFYKHVLHRPYATPTWMYERMRSEYEGTPRAMLATTVWCRLVRL